MFNEFIGLEVCQAEQLLKSKRIDNFKFVYYIDRKQRCFDKKIVVSAKFVDDTLVLTVCPMQFAVVE